jgi:glycosyltransferase involved in cell wall biosynthesis
MVGIFHDFNFKYYFTGTYTFNKWQLEMLRVEIPKWIQCSTPVVSTYFMANELKKFYPESRDKVKVVHLAPMSTLTKVTTAEANKNVSNLGINTNFILYPTNLCSHKNIGPLLSALLILKNLNHDISLVLTGPGTEIINGHACEIGIEIGKKDQDVFGLGYVTNTQMDSLIQRASVVVSTSLYEVAMSNIPSFLEHIKVQDVRAEIFDPRSPVDIANKIHNILSNPEKAQTDAAHSRKAIEKISWAQTAEKYLDIFDESISRWRQEKKSHS